MTKLATIFGGSGFIGRHIVKRLAAEGWRVRVAVRHPDQAAFLQPMGDMGQIVPVRVDITDDATTAAALAGAQAAINLVGILHEKGRATFRAIHVEGPGRIAKLAREAGVQTLLHMSALGADKESPSAYGRSKALGEDAVLGAFPTATIFRPSVVFGPEDGFFNRFAAMAKLSPFLPVFTRDGFRLGGHDGKGVVNWFGSGGPRFQPVYVGDVAAAFMAALNDPLGSAKGKVFELGGPRAYTMKEIMELILDETEQKRALLPLPFKLGEVQAAILQFLPNPPLTPDQMAMMRVDNVAHGTQPGLRDLGIEPTAAEAILPTYLRRYRDAGEARVIGSKAGGEDRPPGS